MARVFDTAGGGGGGKYCAARWGRIFTTGLTIMGLHFQYSYQNGVAHFLILG